LKDAAIVSRTGIYLRVDTRAETLSRFERGAVPGSVIVAGIKIAFAVANAVQCGVHRAAVRTRAHVVEKREERGSHCKIDRSFAATATHLYTSRV